MREILFSRKIGIYHYYILVVITWNKQKGKYLIFLNYNNLWIKIITLNIELQILSTIFINKEFFLIFSKVINY